jgi:glutaconate CoA-transferase subunit A
MALGEAIDRYLADGMSVVMGTGLEGFIPFAAGHEIIRQGKRDLTLIGPISDILFDQLIGAGCVRKVIAAWVGNVSAGSAYNYRRAVEEGIPRPVEVEDHTNFTIALSLHAAALGIPFIPARTALGSDVQRRNANLLETSCPYTGEKLIAVRAIQPDVAIVHVQRADESGNCHLWGNLGVTIDAVRASRAVIVTAEEIVPSDVILSDPNRTVIPGTFVTAVVHEPWGAHPSPVVGFYNRDSDFFHEYHRQTVTREKFLEWLNEWVLGVKNRDAYLEQLGQRRLQSLRPKKSARSVPVEFGY